ncbi:unnamed protein product [Xylocopa violacea]|uniref:Uncharacterized protein n=1 Tax=Xylocopa violacea TaxID=135666 RepID=A0ABP1N6D1_XYLVO
MPRSLLNTSRSGYVINETHRLSNKTPILKKSLTTATHKYNSTTKNQDRLVGGADVPEETEDASKPTEDIVTVESLTAESSKVSTTKTENGALPTRTPGPCCTCMGLMPGSTGDKKVDEMIDFVHENLQNAGKALASLKENFEHESKVEPCTQVKPS